MKLLIAAVLVAVLVFFWWMRRQKMEARPTPQDKRPELTSTRSTASFHAVSIKHAENACEAAKAMAGMRFLSSAAPRLPLGECNAQECLCRFIHHADRRSGNERRNPYGSAIAKDSADGGEDRRAVEDRRDDS